MKSGWFDLSQRHAPTGWGTKASMQLNATSRWRARPARVWRASLFGIYILRSLQVCDVAQAASQEHMFYQCSLPTSDERGIMNWSIDLGRGSAYRTQWDTAKRKWGIPEGPFDVALTDATITLSRTQPGLREQVQISRSDGNLSGQIISDESMPQSPRAQQNFTGSCNLVTSK